MTAPQRGRVGRPLGADSRTILSLVGQAPRPLPQLVEDLGRPYRTTARVVESLVRGGHLEYGDKVVGLHDRPARLLQVPGAAPVGLMALPAGFFARAA